jgi:hypothetical protein
MALALRVRMLDGEAIRSRSSGPLAADEPLDPGQLEWRHLELGCALPHPWFEDQLARALGISPARLARAEPQGWRELAVAQFDLDATLLSQRDEPSADPARLDLLERMRDAGLSGDDWLIDALPIPPAELRVGLERRYAVVQACVAELREGWTPARERSLARALGRLFEPPLRVAERLRLEGYAPNTVAGPVIPDPNLTFEQLGLADSIAAQLGVEDGDDLLILVRGLPASDAVLSLRAATVASTDRVFWLSPLLLAALCSRSRGDACELELVVGRGHGLQALDPTRTVFARPASPHGLLPKSVAAIIDRVDPPSRESWRRFDWQCEPEVRRALLHEAEQRLRESLETLTTAGLSLCHDDLATHARAIESLWSPIAANFEPIDTQYGDGLITHDERVAKIADVRQQWREAVWSHLRGHAEQLDLWLTRRQMNLLLGGVRIDAEAPRLAPQTLVRGLDPHAYFMMARVARRDRVDVELANESIAEATRMSIAALRDDSRVRVADCGLEQRQSAVRSFEESAHDCYEGHFRFRAPHWHRPPTGVQECGAPRVCDRCWSEVDSGRVDTVAARAGLELARMFHELEYWWSGRHDYGQPLKYMQPRRSRCWTLIASEGLVRIHGLDESSSRIWVHDAYVEIVGPTGVRTEPLPFGARVNVRDGQRIERRMVVAIAQPSLELGGFNDVTETGPTSLRFRDDDGRVRTVEFRWPWAVDRSSWTQYLHRGVPDEQGRWLKEPWRWFECDDWRVLLRRGLGPLEVLSPVAGRLRIEHGSAEPFALHVDIPADDRGPARTWTQRCGPFDRSTLWAADGDPVQVGQRLLGGLLDLSARAACEPEWTREWLLELLVSLMRTSGAYVDWRALELYARLATTPRDRYRTLAELARDHADAITRMRVGSLFEELRAAVVAGLQPLRDPSSLALRRATNRAAHPR